MIRLQSPEDHGLALDAIQIDGGTQSRATLNEHVVSEYAEAIKAGATFPPIVVFYDGKKHWLADGFHRFHAYQKLGRENVAADVRQGTRRDAILHSVGANEMHGLRRTRDDKRRAVETLLNDPEWSAWSDNDIRQKCHVSLAFVQKQRQEVTYRAVSEKPRPAPPPPVPAAVQDRFEKIEAAGGTPRFYKNKHGKVGVMNVAGINAGRKNAREALVNDEPSPEAGPQAEAFQSQGTGAGTLADREGRHEGEAASVDLPTISPRNIFDELVRLWKEADAGVRQDFKAYITGSEAVAKLNLRQESNPAPGTGGDDVDRSAERASSAVEVGATNSPDGAQASLANGPCEAVSERTANLVGPATGSAEAGVSGQPEVIPALTGQFPGTNVSGPERAGVTAGETALTSQSTAPAVEAVAGNPQAPRDPATAEVSNPQEPNSSPVIADSPVLTFSPASGTTFENPRCLQPYTCHLSHSRDACHDCLMAWSRRPKTEQIRLWAEANEAARAA
ncbi:hypothetical protein [Mesorhizobium sp. 2RAF21]|jgi:uncharacterized ParB-like nuclease family protein|uniref:ParB/RepB/Spo0J family partition protein n=1 Tax=Mesorhizobium sp. 2RAF21 TaxID=3232995 RepID=UPI003F9B97CD|nr:ParB N-terminal domain-containing protein [Dolichospermum sp. ST_sed6]